MKILVVVSTLLLSGCRTVAWIGKPVTNNDDRYFPQNSWYPCVNLGLRSDGMVVWSESKKEGCK